MAGRGVNYKDVFDMFEKLRQEMNNGFAELREEIASGYVKKAEFEPVKSLVYGLVGLVLITVFGAVLKVVILAAH